MFTDICMILRLIYHFVFNLKNEKRKLRPGILYLVRNNKVDSNISIVIFKSIK